MAETESVVYQVTDSAGNTAQKTLSLTAAASGSLAIVSPAALPAAVNGGYLRLPAPRAGRRAALRLVVVDHPPPLLLRLGRLAPVRPDQRRRACRSR